MPHCDKCDRELSAEDAYCPSCGQPVAPLSARRPPPAPAQAAPRRSVFTKRRLAVAVVVLVVIGLAMISHPQTSTESTSSSFTGSITPRYYESWLFEPEPESAVSDLGTLSSGWTISIAGTATREIAVLIMNYEQYRSGKYSTSWTYYARQTGASFNLQWTSDHRDHYVVVAAHTWENLRPADFQLTITLTKTETTYPLSGLGLLAVVTGVGVGVYGVIRRPWIPAPVGEGTPQALPKRAEKVGVSGMSNAIKGVFCLASGFSVFIVSGLLMLIFPPLIILWFIGGGVMILGPLLYWVVIPVKNRLERRRKS